MFMMNSGEFRDGCMCKASNPNSKTEALSPPKACTKDLRIRDCHQLDSVVLNPDDTMAGLDPANVRLTKDPLYKQGICAQPSRSSPNAPVKAQFVTRRPVVQRLKVFCLLHIPATAAAALSEVYTRQCRVLRNLENKVSEEEPTMQVVCLPRSL